MVDPFFTSQGINFTQQINNPGGPGNLTLIAIPDASSKLLMSAVGAACGVGGALVKWTRCQTISAT